MSRDRGEVQVDQAIVQLRLQPVLRKLPPAEALRGLASTRGAFIEGNPRALWLGLRNVERHARPYTSATWESCLLEACATVGATDGWLILEADGDEHPVYRCSDFGVLPRVLGECLYFEYYLVDERSRWLIADTEHNEILVATHASSDS
jgi:hypothetical protein